MTSSARWSIPCEDRDFVEWHQGCGWCAVWVLLLDQPAVQQAMALARERLAAALLPRHARQPHITLAYRGLCERGGHHLEECSAQTLQADLAALRQLSQAPFALQVAGIGSFETVPYLAVQDNAALHRLHHALTQPQLTPSDEEAPWVYVPHVTVGHYAQRLPLAQAVHTMAMGDWQAPPVTVRELALVRYASADIAGPLVVEGRFSLASGTYQAAANAFWPQARA